MTADKLNGFFRENANIRRWIAREVLGSADATLVNEVRFHERPRSVLVNILVNDEDPTRWCALSLLLPDLSDPRGVEHEKHCVVGATSHAIGAIGRWGKKHVVIVDREILVRRSDQTVESRFPTAMSRGS